MLLASSVAEDFLRGILQGLPPGAVYGLIAVGFVLAYKTSGVFNLAFGAQAYISAALFFHTRNEWHWNVLVAFTFAVFVVAPSIGLILERLIFRHLPPGSALAKLVIAIGLSVALPHLFELLIGFEPVGGRTPEGLLPNGGGVFYDPFGVYPLSRNELTALVVAVIATALLTTLFRFSAIGLQMRAAVESPRMTELNGIRADRVAAFSWALSSTFAGLAGVLMAPRFNTLAAPDYFNLIIVAITAAAFGRLMSLPRALVGGLGLGILIAQVDTFLPRFSANNSWVRAIEDNVTPAMPFIALFLLVAFWPPLRANKDQVDPLSGVDPPPQLPVAVVRTRFMTNLTHSVGVGFLSVVGFVVMTRADKSWVFLVAQAVIISLILLSITVLTGLGGMISLSQGSFAAIGAFTVFQLADRTGMSTVLGAVIGALVAAAISGLLAIPLVRLGGMWVPIATLAFASFFDAVIVKLPFVGGGDKALIEGTRIPRPVIGPWNLTNDKTFLVFVVLILLVVSAGVIAIRSGTLGRSLAALRGSEVASQSIGISPVRPRVIAFVISGFIAGLGGALLGMQQENVNYAGNFTPYATLFWLVLVVTLGSRTVEGAIQGGVGFSLFDRIIFRGDLFGWILRDPDRVPGFFPVSAKWRFVLFGLSTIGFAKHPEGLVESGKRKSHERMERRRARREARKSLEGASS
jgi:branched-subunit amino acid ABC-type transport system permease component